MPLTETIYTIPRQKIEFSFQQTFSQSDNFYRSDVIDLGFGLFSNLSLWVSLNNLHNGPGFYETDEMGDLFFKIWYYIGDYAQGRIHLGFLARFRFPTGPNVYQVEAWRGLNLGKNEIKLGPVVKFDIFKNCFLHFNFFYTLREGSSEKFWEGFAINPIDADTYAKFFGFNFLNENAFFYWKRFLNDYFTISLAFNSNFFYPVIVYFEIYGSFRFYRGDLIEGDISIEGSSLDILLLSFGVRYFFTRDIYLGIYAKVNPLMSIDSYSTYLKAVYGIKFAIQF